MEIAARSQSKKLSKSPPPEFVVEVEKHVHSLPSKEEQSEKGRRKSKNQLKATSEAGPSNMDSHEFTKEEGTARSQSKKLSKAQLPESRKDTDIQPIKEEPIATARSKSRKLSKAPSESQAPNVDSQPIKDTAIARSQPEKLSSSPGIPKPGPGSEEDNQSIQGPKGGHKLATTLSKRISKSQMETVRGSSLNVSGDASSIQSVNTAAKATASSEKDSPLKEETRTLETKLSNSPPMETATRNSKDIDNSLSKNESKQPKKSSKTLVLVPIETISAARSDLGSSGQSMPIQDKLRNQTTVDERNAPSDSQLKKRDHTQARSQSSNPGRELGTDRAVVVPMLEVDDHQIPKDSDLDMESGPSSPSSEGKRSASKKLSKGPIGKEVSEEVRKRKETIKTLLVSSDILLEEEEIAEKVVEEEPPPQAGNSHFKFLKSRCGKLVNLNTWVPAWQGYNMLETEKSWKPIDEWAPTRQFIRYQEDLVVWRHAHPLAQHIGWDRGCWARYYKRPMVSSSWDN